MVKGLEAFGLQAYEDIIVTVHSEFVALTPKRTGFASRWELAINSYPPVVPGEPEKPRYPLIGEAEASGMLAGLKLGDEAVMVSPAAYIWGLANPGMGEPWSKQAPSPFPPIAINNAIARLSGSGVEVF